MQIYAIYSGVVEFMTNYTNLNQLHGFLQSLVLLLIGTLNTL